MGSRTLIGALGSLALHVAVIVSLSGGGIERPPPPPPDDELVAIDVMSDGPPAPRASARVPEPGPQPEPESSHAPEPEPPPVASPTRPSPRRAPAAPGPEPEPDAPEPDALEPDALEPEPSTEPGQPAGDGAGGLAESDGESKRASTKGSSAGRHGRGASGPGGRGTFDSSAYGNEIIRLVLAQLDEDPVPGLTPRDGIQVLLRIKPDGSLAWTGAGRYGFAQVLASSVGPVRTRAILKRIEQASRRFPAHPAGLKRRHYVVDVTVKFSRTLARG